MTTRRTAFDELNPRFGNYIREHIYGEIWERPGLSKRDRSIATVAALTALYRTNQLRGHLKRALDNGVTREELIEVIEHMAYYAGWPNAINAYEVAREVFKDA